MARSKKKASTIKVDFTGVESSGQVQEGRQILTVKEVELKTSENSGNDYLNWKFSAKGGTVYHSTSLQPQTLWNLRNVLEAMGMEVPESSLDIDLTEFPDMQLGAEIEHEKYQGKKKPVIVDVFPVEELEESEDEESDEESEEESEDITFEDVMEMDMKELLELAEEEEIKVTAKAKKKLETLRDFIADKLELEAEPEGEDDDDEESGDDLTYGEVMEMDKDELLEVAEENEIKVPARVKKNLTKLRAHIATELELEEGEEEEEAEEAPAKTSRKRGSKTLQKGATVTFEDDGEEIEGKVLSINTKESFAVIDVEGEEWEVELEDIKL